MDAVWSQQRGTLELQLERENGRSRAVLGWSWNQTSAFPAGPTVPPETLLAESELGYWRSLAFPRRSTGYLLGRDAAKSAVGAFAGIADLRTFAITPGVLQQPVVSGASADPIGVSIAHCDAVACALAFPEGHPMGIDVEQVDERRAAIIERELLGGELRALESTGVPPAMARTVGWTAKEALAKALRCGLTCPFSILALTRVTVGATGTIGGEFENFGQYRFESWMHNDVVIAIVMPKRTRWA